MSKILPYNIISNGIETVYSGQELSCPTYILKSQVIKDNCYVPLQMSGRVIGLNNIEPSSTESLLIQDYNLYTKEIYCNTALTLLKEANTIVAPYYVTFILDRNSVFYGNSTILIDSTDNVIYISCYNTDKKYITVFINKKAITKYGALSKVILGDFIRELSDFYIFNTTNIRLFMDLNKDLVERRNIPFYNIEIIDEDIINSFISKYQRYSEVTSNDTITFQLHERLCIEDIKNNLFV